ncbi:MAG: hypothetical protein LBL66_05655 [Clostridiales bacterium]|jgi:L-fucose isomerase-like protein|nr:hypothetical protein [Clostridiales bacterium]
MFANFGDENGAAAALKNCGVPVLLHAYPDKVGEMDFAHRRDALCGKIAMANVLRQHKIKFTNFWPFTVNADSPEFLGHIERFTQICRVTRGMKFLYDRGDRSANDRIQDGTVR